MSKRRKVRAVELTGRRIGDAAVLSDLLDRIPEAFGVLPVVPTGRVAGVCRTGPRIAAGMTIPGKRSDHLPDPMASDTGRLSVSARKQ